MNLNLLDSKKLWTIWVPRVGIAVFFILCYLTFRKELSKINFENLPRAYGVYFLVVGMICISYAVRAMRWRQYLLILGYELPMMFGLLTYIAGFAYTLAPGKVGELMKATYYRPYKIPMTVVTSAFILERLSDLAVFVCLALVFLGFAARGYGLLLTMTGLCIPLAFLLTASLRKSHLNKLEQSAWLRTARITPMVSKLAESIEAAKKLLKFRALIGGLLLGFLAWLCECFVLYVLGGAHATLFIGDAIGIYAAAIVVGAVSFLPGGLGATEAAMSTLLVNYGYSVQDALVLTIVCRLLTLWIAVLLGWIAIGFLKLTGSREPL
jgi:uncharacterized protein (TIRG00374 family)